MRFLALLLALGSAALSGSAASRPEDPSPQATETPPSPSLSVGSKLSPADLARLWAEVARHWSGYGESMVLREFKGTPLRPGARLFTIVPLEAPAADHLALGAEIGDRVEFLMFTKGFGVPLSATEEKRSSNEELDDAYSLIEEELIDPDVKQCDLPAEQLARFLAYVGSHLHGHFSPYALLLSRGELASDRDSWFPEKGREALAKYAVEPRYVPYGFLWEDNCVLEFRTADGLGRLVDWRVDVPATAWYDLARLDLRVRYGVWTLKPWVIDYGPIRMKPPE